MIDDDAATELVAATVRARRRRGYADPTLGDVAVDRPVTATPFARARRVAVARSSEQPFETIPRDVETHPVVDEPSEATR
ncbi:hypothetical protein ACFQJD_10650 [Haloplanus sp. GCM10025708]|uniref:hypothetical protein n=1 Tax=Haloplanus sp. GCM10025708 TaxID=3252679 RepID=UPI00361CA1EF